jgi:hypothetical protein
MANFLHKRNGLIIDEPRNWDELEISKNFLDRNDDVNINITNLQFAGDEAKDIMSRILNGLSGGVGVFEGDKYSIEVGETGNPIYIFDGYLDYADGVEFRGCNEITVALKKKQGTDWLNDVADGFSFRYLFDKGTITNADFKKVPYVINYIPDNMQLIMLSISLFMMTKELVQAIRNTAEAIGDVVDASTPVLGVGVGFGAVVVTAWDLGNFILVVLKLVAWIAYTIAIIIAIKNLIEEIINQLLPPKRDHLGMTLYDLFRKGAEHLGLGFSSSLLNARKDWVIIPSKGHKGGKKPTGHVGSFTESGVPNAESGFDTFGDLIRVWSKGLNADYRIINGVFHFERADYWDDLGNYTIPDYFTDQKELQDVFKLNLDEVVSNYNINWGYDTQDQNTLDNQVGRIFQAILEPNVTQNQDLINLKNLEEVAIPCSLGLRKNELTRVEEVLKDLAGFIDGLTGIFGGGTNFKSKIENRKGALLLSSDFITIPKMVVMSGSKLAQDQRDKLSATRLWNELHFINSFAEINGVHNQYYRYEKVKVPFCLGDFVDLLNNNNCKTINGERAKIETLKWRVWDNTAIIDYRVKKKYTNNLSIKYVE